MALALLVKEGRIKPSEVSEEVRRVAESMSEEDLREFAKTKEKNLPEKKTENTKVSKYVI